VQGVFPEKGKWLSLLLVPQEVKLLAMARMDIPGQVKDPTQGPVL
jgi:hypothetical protein